MALINFSWIKRFEKQYHEVPVTEDAIGTASGETEGSSDAAAVEGSCGADSDEPAEKADGEVSGDEGDNDAVKAAAGLTRLHTLRISRMMK